MQQATELEDKILTIDEVAKLLRITPATVKRLVHQGQIQCFEITTTVFSKLEVLGKVKESKLRPRIKPRDERDEYIAGLKF